MISICEMIEEGVRALVDAKGLEAGKKSNTFVQTSY